MKPHEAQKLVDCIKSMVDTTRLDTSLEPAGKTLPSTGGKPAAPLAGTPTAGNGFTSLNADAEEKLYQRFKARIIDEAQADPILLRLIMVQPEIVVGIERRVQTIEGKTLRGRLASLIKAGYFKEPKATGTIRKELARTGADPGGGGTLSENLSSLRLDGFLVKEGDGWQAAPGVKISEQTIEA